MDSNKRHSFEQTAELYPSEYELYERPARQPTRSRFRQLKFWHLFPKPLIAAFFGIAACWTAMIIILISSNNSPVANWQIQPSVYLSICSALAGICLRYTFSQGFAIRWWLYSSTPNRTVKEVHKYWTFGDSAWSALTAGKAFGLLNIASIACTLLPITSPLLQRASVVVSTNSTQPITVRVPIATTLPSGYTGFVAQRGRYPSGASADFVRVINDYTKNTVPANPSSGCRGICPTTLKAVGFAMNCTEGFLDTDRIGGSASARSQAITVFNVTYDYMNRDNTNTYIVQNTYWKESADFSENFTCRAHLSHQRCVMQPAVLSQPVLLQDDTIILQPNTSYKDDVLDTYLDLPPTWATGADTLSGMYLMLHNTFASASILEIDGAIAWQSETNGTTPFQYQGTNNSFGSCNNTWSDPTTDLLNAARQIMFRTALLAGSQNSSYIQQVQSNSVQANVVFQADFRFLGLSIMVSCLAAVAILSTLRGYKTVGRKLTLSPVDVARLFDLSLLKHLTIHEDLDEILLQSGHLQARAAPSNENSES